MDDTTQASFDTVMAFMGAMGKGDSATARLHAQQEMLGRSNAARIANGKPYNEHFRPYNTDLKTTSRCCMGEQLSCDDCYNIWPHTTWIMMHQRKHMGSMLEFANWLTTSYVFSLLTRWVDYDAGVRLLPEIHALLSELREEAQVGSRG